MPEAKKAAFDPAILEKPIDSLSAREFLTVLGHDHYTSQVFRYWPEKKKIELYLEPEGGSFGKLNIKEIVERLKGEKKKAELEIPDWRSQVIFERGDWYRELVRDVANEIRQTIPR